MNQLRPYIAGSRLSLFLLSVALLSGCAHVYRVTVDAAAQPDAASRFSYSLKNQSDPATARVGRSSGAAAMVKTALSAKGMFESAKTEDADIQIDYNYGLSTESRKVKRSETIYHDQAGPRSDDGYVPQVLSEIRFKEIEETTYTKELHLVATEKKPAEPNAQQRVWDISISYQDEDPDLEKAMPLLAAAACDRIGTNTDGPITVRLRSKDEVVAFINRGM